mgnify:CR=1 FL=1
MSNKSESPGKTTFWIYAVTVGTLLGIGALAMVEKHKKFQQAVIRAAYTNPEAMKSLENQGVEFAQDEKGIRYIKSVTDPLAGMGR